MQDILQELRTIPKQGIYILKNNNNKVAYINYSSNIPYALVRYLNNESSNTEYIFEVLEIVTSKELIRLRCQFYKDQYSNMGYSINKTRVCNLKLKIELLPDFRHTLNGEPLIYVNLVSRGYKKITVGVFEDISKAELFAARFYSNGAVYDIVYSEGQITQEYLRLKHGIYK